MEKVILISENDFKGNVCLLEKKNILINFSFCNDEPSLNRKYLQDRLK